MHAVTILFRTGQNPPIIPHDLNSVNIWGKVIPEKHLRSGHDGKPEIIMRTHPTGHHSNHGYNQRSSNNDSYRLSYTQAKGQQSGSGRPCGIVGPCFNQPTMLKQRRHRLPSKALISTGNDPISCKTLPGPCSSVFRNGNKVSVAPLNVVHQLGPCASTSGLDIRMCFHSWHCHRLGTRVWLPNMQPFLSQFVIPYCVLYAAANDFSSSVDEQ
jgi:hypothetical protein